jgi:hypothetical protein
MTLHSSSVYLPPFWYFLNCRFSDGPGGIGGN